MPRLSTLGQLHVLLYGAGKLEHAPLYPPSLIPLSSACPNCGNNLTATKRGKSVHHHFGIIPDLKHWSFYYCLTFPDMGNILVMRLRSRHLDTEIDDLVLGCVNILCP